MIPAATGEYVEVEGLRTFYIRRGSGGPLVLVHGASPGACATVNWGDNIEFFAEAGFTVYAFDQPGFGRSDNPTDYSMEFRVRHARAFIDAMGVDGYALMGNSQGSYIAARTALDDPRVERLVLVSSGTLAPPGSAESREMAREHAKRLGNYTPSLENMRALTMQTLFNPERVREELVQERYAMSIGKNLEASAQRRAAGQTVRPIWEELKQLTPPVLIVWGANDSGAALDRSLLLFKCIPGAELHIFDRCGHWVQWDQAARFNTLVRDFLLAG
jgi:pimeloyl-ACP methyl ester carboxylesterase